MIFQEDVLHCCQCVKKNNTCSLHRRRAKPQFVAMTRCIETFQAVSSDQPQRHCQQLWDVNRIKDARVLATEMQHWLAEESCTFATWSGDPSWSWVSSYRCCPWNSERDEMLWTATPAIKSVLCALTSVSRDTQRFLFCYYVQFLLKTYLCHLVKTDAVSV